MRIKSTKHGAVNPWSVSDSEEAMHPKQKVKNWSDCFNLLAYVSGQESVFCLDTVEDCPCSQFDNNGVDGL